MAPRTFAEHLKDARLAAGMSQSTLARRAGLTGSYISLLESRRRPPPTRRVIRALSRVLGIEASPLLEAAALERSPPTVRKRFEQMRKERGKVQKTRDRILTTTLFHLSRRPRVVEPMAEFLDLQPGQQALLGRLLGRVRKVRNLDEVETRADTILEDATTEDRNALVRVLPRALTGEKPDDAEPDGSKMPADASLSSEDVDRAATTPVLEKPADLRNPLRHQGVLDHRTMDVLRWRADLFFWRADGDDAFPRIEAGDLLLVDPAREPGEGEIVLLEHEGRIRVGMLHRRSGAVQVAFPRPEVPPLRIEKEAFHPFGVVIEIRRELA